MRRMKAAATYSRGQVWMVHEDKRVTTALMEAGDRGMCKTRPWLIVESNEDLEVDQSRILCMPITSKFDGILRDGDILFRNSDLEVNRLCTKELATKSSSNFICYKFTMPDEIMAEVDFLLARRTGFGSTMKKLDMELRAYEDRIKEIKAQAIELMEDEHKKDLLRTQKLMIPVKEIVKPSRKSALESLSNVTENVKRVSKGGNSKKGKRSHYRKWTYDDYKAIVLNEEGIDTPTLASMYNLDSSTFHQVKYYLNKKFKEVSSVS